ncbi:MAG: hypothetical protein ABSA77_13005 [Thermoguttaceae bacterium]|jgi:hypothetical protein
MDNKEKGYYLMISGSILFIFVYLIPIQILAEYDFFSSIILFSIGAISINGNLEKDMDIFIILFFFVIICMNMIGVYSIINVIGSSL